MAGTDDRPSADARTSREDIGRPSVRTSDSQRGGRKQEREGMETKKILVPTDGSPYTRDAVEAAIHVAQATGAKITALYVVDASTVSMARGDMYESVTEILNEEGKKAVDEVEAMCDAAGVPVEKMIVGGRPADKIIEMSRDYDLIVMSTLGKTGISKYLIGSVAEKVVRMAECRVLTLRAH